MKMILEKINELQILVLGWIKSFSPKKLKNSRSFKIILELSVFAVAAIWLGKDYLNLDGDTIPYGGEFQWVIQTHHFWNWVKECGVCALWNGSEQGGFPALVDLQGANLHPLVILTTWFFGVVNGAKITTVASFWLAGFGQWWLARVLGLGRTARIWSGLIAVLGTHLAGKMELAWVGIIISTAAGSLIFPAALSLLKNKTRRSAAILGLVFALILVAGQGYTQIGLLFASPAFLFLILEGKFRINPIWRKYLLAGSVGLLLAAPLLVPLFHFLPEIGKTGDPSFSASQPIEYLPLNFVIHDYEFVHNESLSKPSTAAYSALYIGWAPIILLFLVPAFADKKDSKKLLFLALSVGLILITASGELFEWLFNYSDVFGRFRGPMLIAPLAVTPLLGLAAYALDKILKFDWPIEMNLRLPDGGKGISFNFKWLLLIPLVLGVISVGKFSKNFMWTIKIEPRIYGFLDILETPSLQWVQPPYGHWIFIETGIRQGLKLSPGILPWNWQGRDIPEPYFEIKPNGERPTAAINPIEIENFVRYSFDDNREYAFVVSGEEIYPCKGYGVGGNLRVECDNPEAGKLVVRENYWSGWNAWMDGERIELLDEQWISAYVPAGAHQYTFRYLPWDVFVGLIFFTIGIYLVFRLWSKPRDALIITGGELKNDE